MRPAGYSKAWVWPSRSGSASGPAFAFGACHASSRVSPAILRGLLRRHSGLDIVRLQDAGLRSADDPAVLAWAPAEGRVLASHDVATVTAFAYARVKTGQPMPGLIEAAQDVPRATRGDDSRVPPRVGAGEIDLREHARRRVRSLRRCHCRLRRSDGGIRVCRAACAKLSDGSSMRALRILILWLLLLAPCGAESLKPRVIVLTNVNSFSPELRDCDGAQSLVRLLLYSNLLDLELLVASSNLEHGQKVRPELLRGAVAVYAKVRPNLLLHAADFPAPERLLRAIKIGQPFAATGLRVNDSIGRSHDTEASEAIIAAGDKDDPRPIWVCAWGGTADIAQAMWKVRATRTEGDALVFSNKFRIHAIGDQDSTGAWIRDNFPTLRYIQREVAFRGMYRGGDLLLVNSDWLKTHVRKGHGVLAENYPDYKGADGWSDRLGQVLGMKESASPSFLALIPNGLNEPERLGLSSWGGRLEGTEMRGVDSRADAGAAGDPDPRLASVYRWRRAVQADFQARLDWCVKPFRGANHAPQARLAGGPSCTVKPGETLALDASRSSDPDNHSLTFEWLIDLPSSENHGCKIESDGTAKARLIIPAGTAAMDLPVLLIVRDNGDPVLEGYARVQVTVAP